MSADSIQTQLDRLKAGDTLKLDPPRNEFQGPLVIRKAVVIEGQGGTIWSARGPVVSIESPGVVLHDVNLEITSRDGNLAGEGSCALMVAQSVKTSLNNVTVRGNVVGLNSEEGNWNCPRAIALGTIKAGMPHEFKVLLSVPVPCALESEIDGLRLAPKTIQGDPVTVTLSLDPLPTGTRLRGQIKLRTALLVRKIAVSVYIGAAATVIGNGQVLWKPGGEPMAPPRPLIV